MQRQFPLLNKKRNPHGHHPVSKHCKDALSTGSNSFSSIGNIVREAYSLLEYIFHEGLYQCPLPYDKWVEYASKQLSASGRRLTSNV